MGAKEKETRCAGASFGFRGVRGLSVIVEDHVACKAFDDVIGMGGHIVEQVNAGIGSGFSATGLLA